MPESSALMRGRSWTRRQFLRRGVGWTGAICLASPLGSHAARRKPLHLACNEYVWSVFYQREQRKLVDHLDQALGEMAAAGINGFEPGASSPRQVESLGPLLRKHGLEMRSLYVNSTLHEATEVDGSLREILAIAAAAKPLGTRILVTNPSPIRWGGPENKDDAQLRRQAEALNRLGRDLDGMGMRLAYHNHDIELRNAAREFHHMLCGTDSRYVHLCLDAHWVYRGSGNSVVALYDVVRLHGRRVIELHLRQSRNHVWTEVLGEGDIDYVELARLLRRQGVRPHLVLEQAVEAGSPHTLDVVAAHAQTCAYARRIFAELG